MKESEKDIEKHLNKYVEVLGGMSIKLLAGMFAGLPDRMCLLPGGIIFFAEIKTTGEKPTKIQSLVHNRIRKLGFRVFVLDSTDKVEDIMFRCSKGCE